MKLSLHLSFSVFSFSRCGPHIKFWFVERFQLSVPRSQRGYTHCLSCCKNHHLTQEELYDSNLVSLLSVPPLFCLLCFKCMLWELNQFIGLCFSTKFEREWIFSRGSCSTILPFYADFRRSMSSIDHRENPAVLTELVVRWAPTVGILIINCLWTLWWWKGCVNIHEIYGGKSSWIVSICSVYT